MIELDITADSLAQAEKWRLNNKLFTLFPETGPLSYHNYPEHMKFIRAGKTHMTRLCCAGNRTGKSEMAAWEVAIHATGEYPAWWEGRRFTHAVDIWVAGETSETTRDILQAKLCGQTERGPGSTEKIGIGTGMIPADRIVAHAPKAGVPNAIDTVWVKHKSGKNSSIGFKSYGKDTVAASSWMGTRKHVILMDEEPDIITYNEAMMRLMSTVPGEESGMMIVTFTPLKGYTEVVKQFLESNDPDSFHIFISWDQCPHLSATEIERMSRKFLPSQLKARSRGIPAMGEGAIYPIDVDDISVDPFKIPDYWQRCYGMDVGKTAAVWLARNPDNDQVVAYDEYFSTEYNPVVHADAIKKRGPIPGVIDPSSLQSNQMDGQKLFEIYKGKGLDIEWEKTGVEAGIQMVWERLNDGTLKFFRTLGRLRQEFERYHRITTETRTGSVSKIVKKDDHLLDACLDGDTEVITIDGKFPIRSLVGKSGLVFSRFGLCEPFSNCRLTREAVNTIKLCFNDGSFVISTPDHEFLSIDNHFDLVWVQAQDMIGRLSKNLTGANIYCELIEDSGVRDVYCMDVPGSQSFCVANGQVVHNCRYGIVSGLKRAKSITQLSRLPDAQKSQHRSSQPGSFFSGGDGLWMG